MIDVDVSYVTFIVGTLLPGVTALVTNRFAAGWLKGVVLAALSLLAATGEQVIADEGTLYVSKLLSIAAVTFIVAVAAHFQLWKPLGVTGSNGVIARVLPEGLGAPGPPFEV